MTQVKLPILADIPTVKPAKERHKKPPSLKYSVIYMDPPWPHEKGGFVKAGKAQGESRAKYREMSYGELCAMRPFIRKLAHKDCCLFMWTTVTHLPMAINLGSIYGFEYCTLPFVWYKIDDLPGQQLMFPTIEQLFLASLLRKGTGFHTSIQTEYCLLFKQGGPGAFEVRMEDQVIFAPIREHSRKPERAYDIIERAYPSATRIELFARQRRKGWTSWGDQIDWFRPALDEEVDDERPEGDVDQDQEGSRVPCSADASRDQ